MSIAPVSPQAIQLANEVPLLTVKGITEDVFVKGLHSHNDYWREIPLLSAIMKGVQSVEADIWAFNESFVQTKTDTVTTANSSEEIKQSFGTDELYVGHDLNFLNDTWTLSSLYLDPIFDLLQDSNPSFDNKNVVGSESAHGVFYGAASSTLYLFLDTKKDANTSYELVKPLLQKFIDNNYLTYYNNTGDKWEIGPLTIVLTGNLPVELVKSEETRYVTIDGSLDYFNSSSSEEVMREQAKYSVVASASFSKVFGESEMSHKQFNDTEKSILQEHVDLAHKYGVKTRFWEHTNFPKYLRDGQNSDLLEIGSDLLNIDLLEICDQW